MAKILDTNTLTGSVQKMVETPLGLVINGHYYDKQQMIPKPFKLFPTLGDVQDLSMSQKLVLNSTQANHNKSQGDTIVTDRYDPTISYVWTTSLRGNNPRIMKIKENNGDVSLINSVLQAGNPTSYPMVRAYAGQDTNNVYYLISCAGTWHEYLVKIDKVSLAMTVIEDLSTYTWSTMLKETASHIYYGRKTGYGTNFLKRYNKTSAAIEVFPVTAKTGNAYFSSCYSDIISNSDTNFYSYGIYYNTSTTKMAVTRYAFDTTQATLANVCTETDMTITWGSTVTQFPIYGSSNYFHYEPFITTCSDTGKQYLNFAIYEHCASSTAANLSSYGIYTFLIDNTANTLTFKSFVQPTSDYFRGFTGLKNNTFLVCATPTACVFMNFDSTNEKFVVTDSLTNQPTHIGIDQSSNIWIVNAVNEVEYLNPFVPTNINVNYEMSSYKYDGTDITTYCTVNCQNYSGSYISSNLQLTLKGNGVFTSNGSKVITIGTLTTGDIQVPIKIQGAGAVTIYPQLVM